MIVFYDGNSNKLIGTVKQGVDGLVASVDSLKEFEFDNKESIKLFFEQFSDWSNGYMYSFEISDNETPAPVYETELPEKTVWTAEEVQAAEKKFKEFKGSVDDA